MKRQLRIYTLLFFCFCITSDIYSQTQSPVTRPLSSSTTPVIYNLDTSNHVRSNNVSGITDVRNDDGQRDGSGNITPQAFTTNTILSETWEGAISGWFTYSYPTNIWILNTLAGNGISAPGTTSAYVSNGSGGGTAYAYSNSTGLPSSQFSILYKQVDARCYTNLLISLDRKIVGNASDAFSLVYSFNATTWFQFTPSLFASPAYVNSGAIAVPAACNRSIFYIGFMFTYNNVTINNPPSAIDNITLTGLNDMDLSFTYSCTNCLSNPGNLYNFNSSSSNYAVGVTPSSYSWTFGVNSSPPTSSSANPTNITYTASGSPVVCLTVTDNFGCTETTCQTLNLITLPVEFLYFTGECAQYKNYLHWETATESNNSYFEVERTEDGLTWNPIGRVSGSGNSTQRIRYGFIDVNPISKTEYYRLKQVDFNGSFIYSKIIVIHSNAIYNNSDVLIYPNPVSGSFTIELLSDSAQLTTLTIYDAVGKIVYWNPSVELVSGLNKINVDCADYNNGMYFVNIFNCNVIFVKQ